MAAKFQPVNDPKCTWIITSTDPYKLPPNTWRHQCTNDKVNGYPGYCPKHMKLEETRNWRAKNRQARRIAAIQAAEAIRKIREGTIG